MDAFYPHQNGELSSSQKQALITLLDFLKNCRPISLVNVDGKIACKMIRIGHTYIHTYVHTYIVYLVTQVTEYARLKA